MKNHINSNKKTFSEFTKKILFTHFKGFSSENYFIITVQVISV